jgi:hypothetical protein
VNNLQIKLKEYNEKAEYLKDLKTQIDQYADDISEQIKSILQCQSQIRYNPLYSEIQYISFKPGDTPKNSDLVKVQELLGANDSKFLTKTGWNGEKRDVIELYYE